jgi:hypothetical protein
MALVFLVMLVVANGSAVANPFASPQAACGRASFATDLTDFQCLGLDNDGAAADAKTEEACIAECCRRGPTDCSIWQFSPAKNVGKDHEEPGCWLGKWLFFPILLRRTLGAESFKRGQRPKASCY